jgi:PAS domain S-box-containing protein
VRVPVPLRVYVTAVAVAGAANLLVVAEVAGIDVGDVHLFLGIAALIALNHTFPLRVLRKDETESLQLEEGFLVAMMLLVPPFATVTGLGLGVLAGNLLRRRPPVKVAFNTGQVAIATGSALLVSRALFGPGAPESRQVLAALAGVVVFFWVNGVLVATLIALADRMPFTSALFDGFAIAALMWAGNVSVGLLAGLAGAAQPWALPVALVPAFTLYLTFAGHLRTRRDHERINGLLRAANQAHASVDPAQVRAALSDAACELLRCRSSRIGPEPPREGELGTQVPTPLGGGEWLVVLDRRGIEPFEPADQATLDALVAVGASALSNATLFEQLDHDRRKLAESMDKLREAETKYRTLVEQLPSIVYTAEFGADGPWRYVSPNIESILGFSPQEWLGDSELWFRQLHPEDRDRALTEAARSEESGQQLLSEYRLLTRDGRTIWFRDEAVVVRDEAGQPRLLQGVLHDITDRKRAEEEVRRLNAELEQRVIERTAQLEAANQAKTDFLSKMSHELRTPLNAILGFGQLLEMESPDTGQLDSVRQILRAGQHLLDLINELLDLARIESGRIALSLEPVDVSDVLQEVLDLMSPLAAERSVALEAPLPEGNRHVLADRQRLKQVLLNLLSNAIKYNREGGTVTVDCCERAEDRLRIAVTDQGPGITRENLGRLFIPFERLEAERGGVEGTGLGLALTHRLVKAMAADIGVQSEVGEGSTFFVELPLAGRPEEGPEDRYDEAGADERASAEASVGARTLLCIEDNRASMRLLERVLAARPHVRLLMAKQGRVGLDLARAHGPDAILLDLTLPDTSGQEVLQELLEDPRTADIPVVVVSADATPDQIERLLAAGARGYLTKPFDVKRFLEVVDALLARTTSASSTRGREAP